MLIKQSKRKKQNPDNRYYRESQEYDKSRKTLDFSKEPQNAFQIFGRFTFLNHPRNRNAEGMPGYSKIYYGHKLTPSLFNTMKKEAAHSAYVNAGLAGEDSETVDYEDDDVVMEGQAEIVIVREHPLLPRGQKPVPIPRPDYKQPKTTGLKTARNGRRYIPLQKEGLNYAWKDVKTGVVYSNGTYARILNKEGADQSKAKPMRNNE
jgi:hypothetical protein